MTIIRTYQNGNYCVTLHEDGTKERIGPEPHVATFPESIDLKITDYCKNDCAYCHESSGLNGKHAEIENIFALTDGLPPGVEIAIGGGNPLEHPRLEEMLDHFWYSGLIPNITINAKDLNLWNNNLAKRCYGIGISTDSPMVFDILQQVSHVKFNSENVVFHAIAGIHRPMDFVHSPGKVLILGFKDYGRGTGIDKKKVEKNLMAWRYWIASRLQQKAITSFDNLALEQLRIRELIGEDAWSKYYMGNDGEYTMYIDAVKMEYAISSTSERVAIPEEATAVDLFQRIKEAS